MPKLTPEQAAKNRERQRKWRERAFKDPDGHLLTRVNVALGSHAAASLKRLSEGYSLTHRELFERLLIAANTAVIESLRGKGAWRFEDGKLEPGALGAFDLTVRRETLADNAIEAAPETLQPNDTAIDEVALPDNAPALTLDPCPPPRTDAELIAILKADGWTQARIAHEIDRDQGRVSRALNRGAKLDDEAHDRLVGLVAEVERSSS